MSPDLVTALRAETPAAPHRLRERVAAVTATTPPERRFTTRRILSFAVPVAAGLSLAAALAVGLNTAIEPSRPATRPRPSRLPAARCGPSPAGEAADRAALSEQSRPRRQARPRAARRTTAPPHAPRRRHGRAFGHDPEGAPHARRLGGYVLSVNYSTPEPGDGTAAVRLRIPVSRVQAAIVEFSAMGRILAQDTQISDLQQGLDELTRRIRDLERRAAQRRARSARSSSRRSRRFETSASRSTGRPRTRPSIST